ncbi:hypothetical protein L9F63_023863, partial [Diploptera punctata]
MLRVVDEGTYTEQGTWILSIDGKKDVTCSIKTEVQGFNGTQFLRDCSITVFSKVLVPIESCPADWQDNDSAQKCQAYTMYTKKSSTEDTLPQVYKNPHCAVCNAVPIEELICVLPMTGISSRRSKTPSLNIIINFMEFEEEIGISDCELPAGFWDPLHNKCINLLDPAEGTAESEEKNSPNKKFNFTCHTISLAESEYERLENGSIKYTGNNSYYTGYIVNEFEFMEDGSVIMCAPDYPEDIHFISGTPQEYLTAFCLTISVICLILHVATYCALPKLCNLPGKNLMSLSWALLFAQLILLVGVRPEIEVPDFVCVAIAVLEHFCFLSAFFWMNVMSVDIWRTFSLSNIRGTGNIKTHRKYTVYAWGSSAIISFIALVVDQSTDSGVVKPFFGRNQLCWFGNGGALGLFMALPLFLLLVVNLCLFIITVRKIWLARRQGATYIRDKTKAELLQTSIRNNDAKSYDRSQNTSANMSASYGQLSGMVEPVFGLLGAGAVTLAQPVLPYALAFAAGAMIYVVVDDIIPEANTCILWIF